MKCAYERVFLHPILRLYVLSHDIPENSVKSVNGYSAHNRPEMFLGKGGGGGRLT